MASNQQGTLGLRIIIILFALGVVAIGIHPIQEEHGSLVEYITRNSKVLAKEAHKKGEEILRAAEARQSGNLSVPDDHEHEHGHKRQNLTKSLPRIEKH